MTKDFTLISPSKLDQLPDEVSDWLTKKSKNKGVHQLHYDNQNYLLISLGLRPHPGFHPEVVEVIEEQESVQIRVKEKKPDPDLIYPQMVVFPYLLGKSTKKVSVIWNN